jgi:hypothetical protein
MRLAVVLGSVTGEELHIWTPATSVVCRKASIVFESLCSWYTKCTLHGITTKVMGRSEPLGTIQKVGGEWAHISVVLLHVWKNQVAIPCNVRA